VELEFGKCWFLWTEENQRTRSKTLGARTRTNNKLNPPMTPLVKISKRISVLSSIRKNLTVDAANKVYQSLVLPVLDYCDVTWNSIRKTTPDKLN